MGMYVPAHFRQDDRDELYALVAQSRLATVITAEGDVPYASSIPVLLDPSEGERGVLYGHVALANPQAVTIRDGAKALVVVLGPDAYVSPSMYPTKREHGKVVPTWNYSSVQLRGTVRRIDDPAERHALVDRLTTQHEAHRAEPWRTDDAPEDFVQTMLRGFVGFALAIEQLEGKWKLSQNRPASDIDGVIDELGASADPRDRALAVDMAATNGRTRDSEGT